MKSIVLNIFFILSAVSISAQVPLNKTVWDCDGNKKSIHDVLGTGKALIVAHKGVDCSNCRSSARPLQTWASNNTSKVEVWGAMTYTYSASSFRPECVETKKWDSTYSWDDIFAFADSSRSWSTGSSPRYFVYSAIDSSIVYQGSSRARAQDSALNHSTITLVGINESRNTKDIQLQYQHNQLIIKGLSIDQTQLSIYDLNGKEVYKQTSSINQVTINTSNFNKGIYILRLQSSNKTITTKKLFLR